MKVVPKKWKSFYLNGHIMGFPPQTQNLEPPRGRSSGVGGATPPPPLPLKMNCGLLFFCPKKDFVYGLLVLR